MAKNYWFKFEWDAWLGDRELRRCSFETRGFWIECICLMEESETWFLEGTLSEIANLLGCSLAIAKRCIAELENTNAAKIEKKVRKTSKSQDFVKVVSRRLLKRYNLREYNRLAKQKERQKQNVKPRSNNSSKNKSLKVLEDSSYEESKEKELLTEFQKEPSQPPKRTAAKLTRIPDPFPLTPEMWAWLAENIPDLVDPNAAHANFVEYWTNAPPGKAEKINWTLTWQKGMRLARKWQDEDKQNGNGTNQKRTGPDRRTDTDILRDSAEYIASKYSN